MNWRTDPPVAGEIVGAPRPAPADSLRWIVRATAHRDRLELQVAPLGLFQPLEHRTVPADSALWRALGVTREDEPELLRRSLLGQRFLDDKADPLVAPPTLLGARPVLLGSGPTISPWGDAPLCGVDGHRLAMGVGLGDLGQLLGTFETRRLVDEREASHVALARRAELALHELVGRVVVLVGRSTATAMRDALGLAAGAPLPFRDVDLPHPSGPRRSQRSEALRVAASALSAAVLAVRGRLAEGSKVEHAGRAAAGAVPVGWRGLAELGVAALPVTPGLPWVAHHEGGEVVWRRTWWRDGRCVLGRLVAAGERQRVEVGEAELDAPSWERAVVAAEAHAWRRGLREPAARGGVS